MIVDGAVLWTSLRNSLGMVSLHREPNFEDMDSNKNSYAITFSCQKMRVRSVVAGVNSSTPALHMWTHGREMGWFLVAWAGMTWHGWHGIPSGRQRAAASALIARLSLGFSLFVQTLSDRKYDLEEHQVPGQHKLWLDTKWDNYQCVRVEQITSQSWRTVPQSGSFQPPLRMWTPVLSLSNSLGGMIFFCP